MSKSHAFGLQYSKLKDILGPSTPIPVKNIVDDPLKKSVILTSMYPFVIAMYQPTQLVLHSPPDKGPRVFRRRNSRSPVFCCGFT
jgi:hypothetical protein